MAFDYSKLKGRIVEKFGTQAALSKQLGISEHSLSAKLCNKSRFTQGEINQLCQLLNISTKEIGSYFFNH